MASCGSPGWPRSERGAIHAGVAGRHAEDVTLARLFVAFAVAQLAVGLLALIKGGRLAASLAVLVNLGAVAAWGATRLWGIGWIDGLQTAEDPQFTDTACAALGAIAVVAAVIALVRGRTTVSTVRLGLPAFAVGVVTLAAMLVGADHSHSHAETAVFDWPRPFDPSQTVDLSGVTGVTPEQELRATALVRSTQDELPAFADVDSVGRLGYRSIEDESTGFEHYINYSLIADDVWLDPTQPESLVYRVDGDQRTLVSAMFIVGNRAIDDPELVDYGGPLIQWHIHDNLCWRGGDSGPQVASVTDAEGNCPAGTVRAGGENPMVHVWITAHECGPFAALEGHGAGQAAVEDGPRTDRCAPDDGHGHAHDGTTTD